MVICVDGHAFRFELRRCVVSSQYYGVYLDTYPGYIYTSLEPFYQVSAAEHLRGDKKRRMWIRLVICVVAGEDSSKAASYLTKRRRVWIIGRLASVLSALIILC